MQMCRERVETLLLLNTCWSEDQSRWLAIEHHHGVRLYACQIQRSRDGLELTNQPKSDFRNRQILSDPRSNATLDHPTFADFIMKLRHDQ